MIGLCYLLGAIALLALSSCGGLIAMLFVTMNRAADAARVADKRLAELDDHKLRDANASTETAVAAERAQERRGDILESDASKPDVDPAHALQRLHDIGTTPPGTDPGGTKRK